MKDARRLSPDDACSLLARMLSAPERDFKAAYYCGFEVARPADSLNWSMPLAEARLLYACIRTARPETVLELGTHLGYSTQFIKGALDANGRGVVVTLDRTQHEGGVPRLRPARRVIPLTADGVAFSETLCFPVDFVFEDGDHTEENTYKFLVNCLPHLSSGGVVVVHDVCFPVLGEAVTSAMRLALGDNFERIVVGGEQCGLGVWVKP